MKEIYYRLALLYYSQNFVTLWVPLTITLLHHYTFLPPTLQRRERWLERKGTVSLIRLLLAG